MNASSHLVVVPMKRGETCPCFMVGLNYCQPRCKFHCAEQKEHELLLEYLGHGLLAMLHQEAAESSLYLQRLQAAMTCGVWCPLVQDH